MASNDGHINHHPPGHSDAIPGATGVASSSHNNNNNNNNNNSNNSNKPNVTFGRAHSNSGDTHKHFGRAHSNSDGYASSNNGGALNTSTASVIGAGLTLNSTSSSRIDFGSVHFLITNGPTEEALPLYLREFSAHGVSHLVRACEPNYDARKVTSAGIEVHEMPFVDGEYPPEDVVDRWLELVFKVKDEAEGKAGKAVIAVHCVAGLGRAPCLVAIALIEQGMEALEAIQFVRQRRRGAINNKQLQRLEVYKRRRKKGACKGCVCQ